MFAPIWGLYLTYLITGRSTLTHLRLALSPCHDTPAERVYEFPVNVAHRDLDEAQCASPPPSVRDPADRHIPVTDQLARRDQRRDQQPPAPHRQRRVLDEADPGTPRVLTPLPPLMPGTCAAAATRWRTACPAVSRTCPGTSPQPRQQTTVPDRRRHVHRQRPVHFPLGELDLKRPAGSPSKPLSVQPVPRDTKSDKSVATRGLLKLHPNGPVVTGRGVPGYRPCRVRDCWRGALCALINSRRYSTIPFPSVRALGDAVTSHVTTVTNQPSPITRQTDEDQNPGRARPGGPTDCSSPRPGTILLPGRRAESTVSQCHRNAAYGTQTPGK
ncbi:hypothetical protein BMG523Draft_03531 [Frankia sp. BMG5.23]|nr:hypothetical protein BMG523Draft_03531 [Frankia sp. BMG5.23]